MFLQHQNPHQPFSHSPHTPQTDRTSLTPQVPMQRKIKLKPTHKISRRITQHQHTPHTPHFPQPRPSFHIHVNPRRFTSDQQNQKQAIRVKQKRGRQARRKGGGERNQFGIIQFNSIQQKLLYVSVNPQADFHPPYSAKTSSCKPKIIMSQRPQS